MFTAKNGIFHYIPQPLSSAALTLVVILLAAHGLRSEARSGAAVTDGNTAAERLVEQARQEEQSGNTARQFALLREAVSIAPDYEAARWQFGQVKVDGKWVAVEEAQRRAAADPKQANYRRLRSEHGESAAGQLALARWCRKNDLQDEARFHWASVLSLAPNHEEALRAVDRRWCNGRLLTQHEITQVKRWQRESKRAAKQWAAKVSQWRRAVSGSDAASRNAALDEIRALRDASSIPALEDVTLRRSGTHESSNDERLQISLAFIEVLQQMPGSAATTSLASHAVLSPYKGAQVAAAEKLKALPQHEYVPLLLSGLVMPIESTFGVQTERDGSVHYWHTLYREGAEQDWSLDCRQSAMQHNLGGRRYTWDVATQRIEEGAPVESEDTLAARKTAVATRYQSQYAGQAATTEWLVWNANQTSEWLNSRIIAVLEHATGKKLGANPKLWWDWWRDENDYYATDDHPVDRQYYSDTDSYYYGEPTYDVRRPDPPAGTGSGQFQLVVIPPGMRGGGSECFQKGTLVWTKTGRQPIESLALGDLVLSQNVNTGELVYKPVIRRTVRPPTALWKLSTGGEELVTTGGHPFWVAGVGWRMAKQLSGHAILHGVSASPRVAAIEPAGEAEAYNLVVADFNTYFVGKHGILVHDNTPRRPMQKTAPVLASE